MSTWKKIIVSGSGAHLSSVTASNGSIISGSLTMSGSIINVNNLDFNMASPAANAAGRLVWDDGNGSLDLGLKGGNVNLVLGQQTYARVYNAEATTLNKGQVVYISGSQGNRVSAKLADYIGEQGSATTIGFVAESIASGAEGFIITNGVLEKLNTVGLTQGALLYLSSSGQYSETKPIAPQHTVTLGYVERVHATAGSIYVKIDNGYELDELHNVFTTGVSSGDLLMYSASLWKSTKQLSGSYGVTGSLQATSFTGSLQGTASYATQALSASFATTASYVLGGGGASVTSPGDNRLITSDGTAGGLVGESNLSFDGTLFSVTGSTIISATTRLTDIEERELTVTIGGTPTSLSLDLSQANVFEVTVNATVNTFTITNPPITDYAGSFTLVTVATGLPYTWNWGSAVTWSGGTPPAITTTTGKKDIYGFITTNQGTNWYGFVGAQNL